jgi:hypothetical protein
VVVGGVALVTQGVSEGQVSGWAAREAQWAHLASLPPLRVSPFVFLSPVVVHTPHIPCSRGGGRWWWVCGLGVVWCVGGLYRHKKLVKSIKKCLIIHTLPFFLVAGEVWVWGSCQQQQQHGWWVEKPADVAASAISGHCQPCVKKQ